MQQLGRYEVTSVDGMVSLIVNLVSKGYRYYFTGAVKAGSDPQRVDERMLSYYDAHLPKWTRERRRRKGIANFRYLRLGAWYIVLATEGVAERFWLEDRNRVRDVRRSPIRFEGYSISFKQGGYQKIPADEKAWRETVWTAYREARLRGEKGHAPPKAARDMKWHVHVRLDDDTYEGLMASFLNLATHRQEESLVSEFLKIRYQPYGPVRVQLRHILRAVNEARKIAGFQRVPLSVIPFKRRIVRSYKGAVASAAGPPETLTQRP